MEASAHSLTCCAEASRSRVRTSASPARVPGSTGHVRVFGESTPVSLASFDPGTLSWRTSQLSLLEEWAEFSGTWPRSGMTRSGIASRLRPLAPLTGGTGSGLLPTPTAKANQLAPSMSGREPGSWLPTPKATDADRGGRGDLLQVVRGNPSPSGHFAWPTPTTRDYKDAGPNVDFDRIAAKSKLAGVVQVRERHWPTPNARDGSHGGASDPEKRRAQGHAVGLDDAVHEGPSGGSLNPAWVEWLMGFPSEWTALEPSVTRSSRRSLSGLAGAS